MDVIELIHHPEHLDRDTLYELRSLLALYPYYQTARLLLLQNLYLLHDPTFDEELRRAAIYITDRRVLFQMIEAAHYQLRKVESGASREESEDVSQESGNRTLSLIDNFLESMPQEGENKDEKKKKRKPTPADAAVDYVAYLMETEGGYEQDDSVPEMKGQISSVTGVRNLFAMALAAQGLDPNSKDEADIEKAYEWCLEYSKNVVAFDSDSPETLLINGGATAAYVFDGQVTKAINETKAGSGDEIVIAEFDEDPIQLGVDEFVIPAGAKNKENAEAFLNFLLDADVMASNLQYMYDEEGNVVSCPNAAALDLMSDEYKSSPAINLPEKMKNNYYLQLDVGDAAKIYDEYWTKFQSEAGEVE